MIQNNLKIALRKFNKQRDYALLNILGLGISVACGILIFALIQHHTSFDRYHKNAERVLRIMMDVKTETLMPFPGVPMPMAQTLREECSFVELTAMRSALDEVLISVPNAAGDKFKEKEKFAWVEPSYLDILDFPMLQGQASSLAEPNTVIITEKIAQKYFHQTEALGRNIRLNNEVDLRVVGVMRNLPNNTDYKQEILASWSTQKSIPGLADDLMAWNGARGENYCFALLKPGHQASEMEPVMLAFRKKYPHPESAELFQYKSMPMLDLHFDVDYGRGIDKKLLWALGLIGVFLLLTACVNFINMATAQALARSREVGVRKSLGSTRNQLFWQFMAETGLIVLASTLTGIFLAWMAVPYMNAWLDEKLQLDGPMMRSVAAFCLCLGVLLTFLAGFYPGLIQSKFNPVTSMKGVSTLPGSGSLSLRKVLVTTQFAISQMLIIGAAVVTAQTKFAQDADWGFKPGVVLTVDIPDNKKKNNLYEQMAQIAGVQQVSLCYQPPASSSNNFSGVRLENRPKEEPWIVNDKPADSHYLETFGLQLVAGRNLYSSDTTREFLVNETFVKKLNLASAAEILNKSVTIGQETGPVVGVVKDYHNTALSEPITPIAFSTHADSYITCAIQLAPGNPAPVLTKIREVWEQNFPDNYYESQFMDERLSEQLKTETTIIRVVSTFACIAIFIGCLGLYGLSTFMVNRKRKEVGVRKTLGASVPGILWLFGKEYFRLILLAFALSAPLAWYAMNAWLQDYTYRISIGTGIFLISLFGTIAVACLTVGIQSIRAALTNPVLSLRSE